jgi:spore coat protein U-like protein
MKLSHVCTGVAMVAALAGATARSADAATVTANLNVTASVIQVCLVTGGNLAFGNYDPLAGAALDQNGSFQVACTKGAVSVTIGLGPGANASGGLRRMTNSTDFLTYEIYKEAGRTTVWGDAGGALVPYAPLTSTAQTFQVFGRIPAGQTGVGVGATYADTVVITVTF